MGTTINPIENTGPDDQGYQARFPSITGRGMTQRLRESRASIPKPKVNAKKFIKAAEGKAFKKKPSVKKGKKPENLRASEAKNQKKGAFGEKYSAPKGNTSKGVRVTESSFSHRMRRFRRSVESEEKAPPGREEQVMKLKKKVGVPSAFKIAWSQYNKD